MYMRKKSYLADAAAAAATADDLQFSIIASHLIQSNILYNHFILPLTSSSFLQLYISDFLN